MSVRTICPFTLTTGRSWCSWVPSVHLLQLQGDLDVRENHLSFHFNHSAILMFVKKHLSFYFNYRENLSVRVICPFSSTTHISICVHCCEIKLSIRRNCSFASNSVPSRCPLAKTEQEPRCPIELSICIRYSLISVSDNSLFPAVKASFICLLHLGLMWNHVQSWQSSDLHEDRSTQSSKSPSGTTQSIKSHHTTSVVCWRLIF